MNVSLKKTTHMNPMITLTIAAALMFSCSPATENQTATNNEVSTTEATFESAAISPMVEAYLNLKTAMFNSNAEAGVKAATDLKSELEKIEGENETINNMISAASDLMATSDLNEQRAAFEIISDNLYGYLKASDSGEGLYRQFCPMAFDFKGAYWISNEKEIANPYFGDEMPKCGTVKEEL